MAYDENLAARIRAALAGKKNVEEKKMFGGVGSLYIPLAEKPGLVKRFGDDYLTYKRNVPRWIPTFRAWPGETQE